MNISNSLRIQLENFGRHRYANLDDTLKEELAIHYKALGCGKLNKACATCVRIAMDKLNQNKDKIRPAVRQENNELHMNEQPPKLHFVGTKQKTFGELRREALELGFKGTRKTTRQDIEEWLKSTKQL
jgi:hypothetical protein